MDNGTEAWRIFQSPIYVEARNSRMANLFEHLDPASLRGKRVLEAGCGTGELGAFFENCGCSVVSVDAREEFLAHLRQKYPQREAYCMDLEHWDPEPLGHFDIVLAFGILPNLAEPLSFLEDCARLADTILIETVIVDTPWASLLKVADCRTEGAWSQVGSRVSSAWIVSTMERYGFVVVDISSATANWAGPFPSVFDWEPRNEGGWFRGNTTLRRMMICRRGSRKPPSPFQLRKLTHELKLELSPSDPGAVRTLQALRQAGYGVVRETHSRNRAKVVLQRFENSGAKLRPLLVHVHLPKCAGTSFLKVLRASFGKRHIDHYPEGSSHLFTREEWWRFVIENPKAVSFSSHSLRVFPPILADRQPLYVAFLRNPLQRYVSHLTYSKKCFYTFPETLRAHLPPDCPDMSLREIAAWLLENQLSSVYRNMLAANFLAEQTWLDRVGAMMHAGAQWLDEGPILSAGFDQAKLALATATLEEFFFVGIVEEMDASLDLLKRKLEPYGMKLKIAGTPVENVSSELIDDLTWLTPTDSVGAVILSQLETDIRLYRRFQSRFRALCNK